MCHTEGARHLPCVYSLSTGHPRDDLTLFDHLLDNATTGSGQKIGQY